MSYKLMKEKGYNKSVILENTDTHATLIIGRVTPSLLGILKDNEGLTLGKDEGELDVNSIWELDIKDDTSKALSKLALTMSKPVRDQSKKAKDLFQKPNKDIDALDVLLGRATYN